MSRRFYRVNSSAVQRGDYLLSGIRTFSQNRNLLTNLFIKYGIPEEYRKIYLYKSKITDKFEDFFTSVTVDIERTKDRVINVFLKRSLEQPKLNYYAYSAYNYEKKCSKEEVMQFYKELHEKLLLKNYLCALKEFFVLDMDLDYLFELSESDKSIRAQKRLYRKRMIQRNQG